ncbi:hypothetical protein TW95_gp0506 [Pandoravirus inopinatum]|uniref:Uncharacterized protein n=1 Tax=Pandoravirus inopinatum TaxID=1605721 RepID=A0A0B5J687_9VIRU|nr:hypothetical protein TW95_gp0506 [Pandoravirus inopinatum]AJF97240.1 hypothetical protein [Pandoravirus inopinatum]
MHIILACATGFSPVLHAHRKKKVFLTLLALAPHKMTPMPLLRWRCHFMAHPFLFLLAAKSRQSCGGVSFWYRAVHFAAVDGSPPNAGRLLLPIQPGRPKDKDPRRLPATFFSCHTHDPSHQKDSTGPHQD